MLISETHLKAAQHLRLSGYHVYREDQISPVGVAYRGLAVLIKRSLVHQPVDFQQHASMDTLGVDIKLEAHELRLYAVYRPPGRAVADEIRADLRTLLVNSPVPTIIAGDFNAKHPAWNASRSTPAGNIIYKAAEDMDFEVSGPYEPTHYHTGGIDDIIDFACHMGVNTAMRHEVLPDLPSDHRPVLLTIADRPVTTLPRGPRRLIDWEEFARHLESQPRSVPISSAEEVEVAAMTIQTSITEALDAASRPAPRTERHTPLPRHLQELIQEKKWMRQQWQRLRAPALKTELNRLTELVKAKLADHRAESWEAHIASITDEVPSIHRLCKQLGTIAEPVRPLLDDNGALKYAARDRAEIFARSLEQQFRPNPDTNPQHTAEVQQHLRDYFEEPMAPQEDPLYFSPSQVQRTIRYHCNPKKAPGPDNISNKALRQLPLCTVAAVTRLFNGILRSGHFPTNWKIGQVIVLPKPGKDRRKAENYRPITLLCTLSKVFERLLLRHLVPHIQPRPEQFGFRAGHSTTLQLTRVLHHMATAMNKKEHTVAVLLDMEKAFDRVWHEGLIYKLSTSTAPRRLVRVVASFLEDRQFRVRVDGVLSDVHPIQAGVPQGSCLSPACYARYTDDIPVVGDTKLALFADDAAYFVSSYKPQHAVTKIQPTLDALPEWLSKWRLAVNVGKTQALITGRTHLPQPPSLLGQPLEWSHTVKYLGVTIDRGLTMRQHSELTVQRARVARTMLRPVLSSKLPRRTKLGLYKLYVRSRLTYASPAWYALPAVSNKKRLRAQETQSLRTIVAAPRYVRNQTIEQDLEWEGLDAFVERLARVMFNKADNSSHTHLQGLAPQHARPPEPSSRALPRELLEDS